jgi:TPR repeat protein
MLGCYFAFGLWVPSSDEQAVHYFQLAAEAGIAEAQYDLGVCLLLGKGTLKLEEEAVRYFKLASEQGNADAHYNLGICYYQGLGIAVSKNHAIHFLEMAVRGKQPKAAEALETIKKG